MDLLWFRSTHLLQFRIINSKLPKLAWSVNHTDNFHRLEHWRFENKSNITWTHLFFPIQWNVQRRKPMKDNPKAMVLASFAADALSLGVHWIYNTNVIDKKWPRWPLENPPPVAGSKSPTWSEYLRPSDRAKLVYRFWIERSILFPFFILSVYYFV